MKANIIKASAKPTTSISPGRRIDWLPALLPLLLMAAAYFFIGSNSTWLTLSIAGVAMGMIMFIMASGLTLIFGLMDVFSFGHGIFITLGAYVAIKVTGVMPQWMAGSSWAQNIAALVAAMIVAMLASALAGLVFERLLIRRIYGQHLKQILVTVGGAVVGEELVKMVWGTEQISFPHPQMFEGAAVFGDVGVEKFRIFACVVGLVIYLGILLVLKKTKIGLLVRAGVQDREMVESLGYRIKRLFIGVFAAGSALGGLGGVMWGQYQQVVTPQMGLQLNVMVFIVIIIGGLGSISGSLIGAILMGLVANYSYSGVLQQLAPVSNVVLMAVILMWRPQGLYPISSR